jgi:zinc protease
VPSPQKSSRLYRALVNTGLASSVGGFLAPTAEPFLYSFAATVASGQRLEAVESAMLETCDRFVEDGPTAAEVEKARTQLRARFVFDADSVTDVAHQLGYFHTIAHWSAWAESHGRLAAVTPAQVHEAARTMLAADNRTIGTFEPTDAASDEAA